MARLGAGACRRTGGRGPVRAGPEGVAVACPQGQAREATARGPGRSQDSGRPQDSAARGGWRARRCRRAWRNRRGRRPARPASRCGTHRLRRARPRVGTPGAIRRPQFTAGRQRAKPDHPDHPAADPASWQYPGGVRHGQAEGPPRRQGRRRQGRRRQDRRRQGWRRQGQCHAEREQRKREQPGEQQQRQPRERQQPGDQHQSGGRQQPGRQQQPGGQQDPGGQHQRREQPGHHDSASARRPRAASSGMAGPTLS